MGNVTFQLGVKSKLRDNSNTWRETKTYSESWTIVSSLTNYVAALALNLTPLFAYATAERARGAEVGLHYAISLENVTAATPPKGAWLQAKQHLDGNLSPNDWPTVSVLQDTLVQAVQSMRTAAGY